MNIVNSFGRYHIVYITESEREYFNENKIFSKELIYNDYFKIMKGNDLVGILLLDNSHDDRMIIDYIEIIKNGEGIGSSMIRDFVSVYKRVSLIHQNQRSYKFWLKLGFIDYSFYNTDCTLLYE